MKYSLILTIPLSLALLAGAAVSPAAASAPLERPLAAKTEISNTPAWDLAEALGPPERKRERKREARPIGPPDREPVRPL